MKTRNNLLYHNYDFDYEDIDYMNMNIRKTK